MTYKRTLMIRLSNALIFIIAIQTSNIVFAQDLFRHANLIGERHLEALKSLRVDPEFESTWIRCIERKNKILDSITSVNAEEHIFIEAPTSFAFFYRNYLNTGYWSPYFLPDNIYDKAWLEYLYKNGKTKIQIHAIDLEFKRNTQSVIDAILGTALHISKAQNLKNPDFIFKELDSLEQSDPAIIFLYKITEIGFGLNYLKPHRLQKLFKSKLCYLDKDTKIMDSIELTYVNNVINSYLLGSKARRFSKRRQLMRDPYFLNQIESINSNFTLISGIAHVTDSNLISNNIETLLAKNGWKNKIFLIQ